MERLKGPLSGIRNVEAQILLSRFLYSQEFAFGVEKLKEFLPLKPEQKEMSQPEFRDLLKGFFFGGIAYGILNERLTSVERLLSPQETDEFYDLLYPTRQKRNLYGLGLQIEGITIPDGILITEHEDKIAISGIFEYSLTYPGNSRKIWQLKHYRNIERVIADLAPTLPGPVRHICFPEFIQRHFGLSAEVEVDPYFEVDFVFPRDDREDLYSKYSNIPGRLIFLPISRSQIGTFLDSVFKDTKNSLSSMVE